MRGFVAATVVVVVAGPAVVVLVVAAVAAGPVVALAAAVGMQLAETGCNFACSLPRFPMYLDPSWHFSGTCSPYSDPVGSGAFATAVGLVFAEGRSVVIVAAAAAAVAVVVEAEVAAVVVDLAHSAVGAIATEPVGPRLWLN